MTSGPGEALHGRKAQDGYDRHRQIGHNLLMRAVNLSRLKALLSGFDARQM